MNPKHTHTLDRSAIAPHNICNIEMPNKRQDLPWLVATLKKK